MKMGLNAINQSGIQRVFAENLARQSRDLGPIALRTPNQPTQRYAELGAAKSMDVKVKSSNWGPTTGHITLDNTFGRINSQGILSPPKTNPAHVNHQVVQEQTSLRDLFLRLGKDYQITDFDDETGQLTFSVLSPHKNEAFKGQFLICLSEGITNTTPLHTRFTREIDIPDPSQDKKALEALTQLTANWDETRYGAKIDALNKNYPLYATFSETPGIEPMPVMVYSDNTKKPYTSDWDMLWVGLPEKALPTALIPLAQTPINTQVPGNMDILNNAITSLVDSLVENKKLDDALGEAILANRQTSDVGVITPWEYLSVLMGNIEYQDQYINHLFQHGPENRTPYRPESLDGLVLHFINGQIILTENESEILQLIDNPNNNGVNIGPHFLSEHFLEIHPKWTESSYSGYPDKWKALAEQQQLKWQTTFGTEPPVLPINDDLHVSEKPGTLTVLDRFHVPKNRDFVALSQSRRHVLDRLSGEDRGHLENHLIEKSALIAQQLMVSLLAEKK